MLERNSALKDHSVAVEDQPDFVPYEIVELRVLPDYQLYLRFADGVEGRVEMREQIFRDSAGVFVSLRDPKVFADVFIDPDFGHAQWANGVDIAPDASHDDIQKYGVQILR